MAGRERLICESGGLAEGGCGVRFQTALGGPPMPAFVVRWKGKPRAYVNECRHQNTELDWNPGDFFDEGKLYLICATHGALYQPDDGLCIAGPCVGASLAPVAVFERDGNIYCIED